MDTLDRRAILDYLQEHKDYLYTEFGVTKMALFGSFARNEAHAESDIDLLIECERASFSNRFALKEHLEKEFGRSVDVGYFSSVRRFYRRYIAKDLIYVYRENSS